MLDLTKQIRGRVETIVITSTPGYYDKTFSRLIGKPVTAKQSGFGGWHVAVAHDAITNPESIWSVDDTTTLYIGEAYARPATNQEVAEMLAPLTGRIARKIGDSMKSYIRATSRDNPFRHWNRIKGNRKVGLPEVYLMEELRA